MDLLDDDGRVPARWRPHVPPFDPASSRAIRDHGALPEFLRTSGPARCAAPPPARRWRRSGAGAPWFTADHPLDYGYGPGSPLAKLVEARGKVAMIGAPWDTMTLLHHAEHLADLPGKRVVRYEVPFATPGGTLWRTVEEFDTADPVDRRVRRRLLRHDRHRVRGRGPRPHRDGSATRTRSSWTPRRSVRSPCAGWRSGRADRGRRRITPEPVTGDQGARRRHDRLRHPRHARGRHRGPARRARRPRPRRGRRRPDRPVAHDRRHRAPPDRRRRAGLRRGRGPRPGGRARRRGTGQAPIPDVDALVRAAGHRPAGRTPRPGWPGSPSATS